MSVVNISGPSSCGCCEDIAPLVPRERGNPPGLSRISARVGTQAAFKADLLGQLARSGALRRLSSREDDDPTIALLDGWASVLDVLTFYQEEIANEGYLRSADERLSVRHLANSVGYKLKPGVGSETHLAFECEVTPATPTEIVIPAGTQAQSTPAPEEMPQIFETKAEITGRPGWNALRPRLTYPASVQAGIATIYLAGTSTGLEVGQPLLFVAADAASDPENATFDLRRIQNVETFTPPTPDDPRPPHTTVTLDRTIRHLQTSDAAEIHALRQRAAAFGHNAIRWVDLPLPLRVGELHPETSAFMTGPYAGSRYNWAETTYSSSLSTLYLDQVYTRLAKNRWIVLSSTSSTALYRVTKVRERTRTKYLVTGKATRLSVSGAGIQSFTPRSLNVLCESELLPVAERPLTSPVSGVWLTLNTLEEGLAPGQLVALSGLSPADQSPVSEVLRIKTVSTTGSGLTRLRFETAMINSYDRMSLRLNANVAEANMGASRGEVLGDADASVPFQSFRLPSTPLTYVSSTSPSGSETTLEVRVDGQLWNEVPSFFGRDPKERVYAVSHGDGGEATVQFGDGRLAGARPASGQSNVTAKLRVGVGTDGNLPPRRIDQLATRPLGVRAVTNPVAAEGAADAEETATARQNAARQTRLVDRIVTLTDYQDFAAGFAGVEKAFAQVLWTRSQRLVHITVAGAGGSAVLPGSTLHTNLRDAIDKARHSDEPVSLGAHLPRAFSLAADLTVRADLIPQDVAAAATEVVQQTFSFDQRSFGKAVTKSEIMSILHACPGVEGVVLRVFDFVGLSGVRDVLPAAIAGASPSGVTAAELLVIDPVSLDLKGTF